MGRVCNGCLNEKEIVNDQDGYCDYCNRTRNIQVKDIFKNTVEKSMGINAKLLANNKYLLESGEVVELEGQAYIATMGSYDGYGVFLPGTNYYEAIGYDDNDNDYTIYFEIVNENAEEEENYCDWTKARIIKN
jgi:hypothetical protein